MFSGGYITTKQLWVKDNAKIMFDMHLTVNIRFKQSLN